MQKMKNSYRKQFQIICLAILLNALFLNIGWTQAKMTLWYLPETAQASGHHHASYEIPCDWNYYHSYDGKDRIIEYGIRNEGDAAMSLTLPLVFEESSSLEFMIMEQPSQATLQPGEEVHFKVKYRSFGAYQPAKAILNLDNTAPNSPDCSLNFRVGGGGFFIPPAFDVPNCFEKSVGQIDFDADNNIEEVITITRTLDEKGNILEQLEVIVDNFGMTLGEKKTSNTFNAENKLLTQSITFTDAFAGFITQQMLTNTYDPNGNLTSTEEVSATGIGDFKKFEANTYDVHNNLVAKTSYFQDPFGFDSFNSVYVYDSNNNLLSETISNGGTVLYTITHTYDANNNLLTTQEADSDPTLGLVKTIINTYDANNNLLTSVEEELGYSKTTTTNTYNAFNSLLNQTIQQETIFLPFDVYMYFTFTYDTNNQLISWKEEVVLDNIAPPVFRQTHTVTPCPLPVPTIKDPCSCSDPLNIKDNNGDISHFHDFLTIPGTPGVEVILQIGNTNFLNNSLTQIPNGTSLGKIPASGALTYDFFHASGASGAITLNIGGVLTNPFDISVCEATSCKVIPTMSQWGLIIFGLLVLNLGLVLIRFKSVY